MEPASRTPHAVKFSVGRARAAGLTCGKSWPCGRPTGRRTLWGSVCVHPPPWSRPASLASSSPLAVRSASADAASVPSLSRPSCSLDIEIKKWVTAKECEMFYVNSFIIRDRAVVRRKHEEMLNAQLNIDIFINVGRSSSGQSELLQCDTFQIRTLEFNDT